MASLTQLLHDLEARLMDPEVRSDTASDLIADDFMEFWRQRPHP
jgi:hypothetical protein